MTAPRRTDAIHALCKLLAPGNRRVASRLALAVSDPKTYATRFAARRAERNNEDSPVDAWVELVDTLGVEMLACGVDWKSAAEDIAGNVRRVLAKKKLDARKILAFYDEDEHLRTKTDAFLEILGDAISAFGLALVRLDIDSDSHELTIVKRGDLVTLTALAKRAGGEVTLLGPKTPRKTPLPSVAKKAFGKFMQVKVGWAADGSFLGCPGLLEYSNRGVALVDCRVWPPRKSALSTHRADAGFSYDGRDRVVYRLHHEYDRAAEKFAPRPEGTLRVECGGRVSTELLGRVPDAFESDLAVFCGDLAVLFPTEPTVRDGKTKRPLVWNGRHLALAAGLRDAKAVRGNRRDPFPSFLRRGYARTGAGEDVLVWEGRGYVASKGRFVERYRIADVPAYWKFAGVPSSNGGFFYVRGLPSKNLKDRRATIREVTRDGDVERGRLGQRVVEDLRLAPDGSLVLSLNRSGQPKAPLLVVFDPSNDAWREVPPAVFGVRRDDPARAIGFGRDKKRGDFLWVLDGAMLKSIAWAAITALPVAAT